MTGPGLVDPELLQIGATIKEGKGGKQIFAPIFPSFEDSSKLSRLGFFNDRKSKKKKLAFLHPNTKETIPCSTQAEGLEDLFEFLEKSLRKSDKSGILLVVLHREVLLAILG